MSNSIAAFKHAGLPSNVEDIKARLQRARAQAPAQGSGSQYLKMNQVGSPVAGMLTFGADQTEVDPDSMWAVNSVGMQHGFILRDGGSVNGEVFVSILEDLPNELGPTRGNEVWRQAYKCEMVCVSDSHLGTKVEYSGDAGGVVKLFADVLLPGFHNQVDEDPEAMFPVIQFSVESYYSTKQKKDIYEAHGSILEWITNEEVAELVGDAGETEGDEDPDEPDTEQEPETEVVAEEKPKPKRRAARRRK